MTGPLSRRALTFLAGGPASADVLDVALRLPGDEGAFGPGSVTWRVVTSPASVVAGLASAMSNALRPHAAQVFVARAADAQQALQEWNTFLTGVAFGTTELATTTFSAFVSSWEGHERVVTLLLTAYQQYSGNPLTTAEAVAFVHEWKHLASLAGLRGPSATTERRPDGVLTGEGAQVLLTLRTARLPRGLRLAYRSLLHAATLILPADAQALLEPMRTPLPDAVAGAAARWVVRGAASLSSNPRSRRLALLRLPTA